MTVDIQRTVASDHPGFVLKNKWLRVVVLPGLGGRIWELLDVRRSRQWIWHRPGVALRKVDVGSTYDDVWAGGWEELFPNDAPGWFEGRKLPDHGEWWTLSWSTDAAVETGAAVLRMQATSTICKAACTKEIRLETDSNVVNIAYSIRSLETVPFHFLFKQHLPVQLSHDCELVIPGGDVCAVDPAFGTLLSSGDDVELSADGDARTYRIDGLRRVPSRPGRHREFVYLSGLAGGTCGVDDRAAGASLRLNFDVRHWPYLWLFLTYGGWRDCFTAVLEPCTSMPKELSEATRLGQTACLSPGAIFATGVSVRLDGLSCS